MPFSSALYGDYPMSNTAYAVYVSNMGLNRLMGFLMWRFIANPKNNISHGLENRKLVNYFCYRGLVVAAIFIIGLLIGYLQFSFAVPISRMSPMLLWPAMAIGRRIYKVKN
ncbi:MAG: hypothetical protein H0W62_04960 [Chitinophagales bacterium]|nr:hypothetical protein [Chitinophagales bacterium]